MFIKIKLILIISLLAVQIISASKENINSEKDNLINEKDLLLENDLIENRNPLKRSAYYQGHGLLQEPYSSSYYGYHIPNIGGSIYNKPFLSGNRQLAFSAPAGFGASNIHYANTPSSLFGNTLSPFHHAPVSPAHFGVPLANPAPVIASPPPIQYAIRPGGAVVQSYNANYPQLQQYHHKHYPSYAVASGLVPAAIAPAPAPIVPFNNIHYHQHPSFVAASPAHIGFSIPTAPVAAIPPPPPVAAIPAAPIIPQHFFINRPLGIQFAAPSPPPLSVISQRPTFVAFGTPSPTLSTFPSVIPIGSGSAISPGQISPSIAPVTPTIQTTLATPWRPIIINNTPPTTQQPQPSGSAANRPPISLLPPYGAPERPNDDLSNYYHHIQNQQQNQQELTEQNYYADQANKGYHY